MTPAAFVALVCPSCQAEAQRTGLDARLFAVQWALETEWGQVAPGDNFAGITCHGGCSCSSHGFCLYPSIAAFAVDYDHVLHNGLYAGVLASAGSPLATQMHALGASPWAGSHYGSPPGQDLVNLYSANHDAFDACTGGAPPPPPQCPPGYTWNGHACMPPQQTPPPPGGPSSTVPLLLGAGGLALVGLWYTRNPHHRLALHAPHPRRHPSAAVGFR